MTLRENIGLATRAIRANKLRTIITIIMISLGLMALLGILTSVEAIKSSVNTNFATLGSNSFNIRNEGNLDGDNGRENAEPNPPITYRQAESFKEKYDFPGIISISYMPVQATRVKAGDKETNPNVSVLAVDENYISIAGYEIDENKGRWFTKGELESASRSVVLGNDVAEKLFGEKVDPLGKGLTVSNQSFRIIGVLKSKGSSIMSSDNIIFIPVTTSRSIFPGSESSTFVITVGVNGVDDLEPAIGTATGLMRQVRKLDVREKEDFAIMKSDSVIAIVIGIVSNIAIGVIFIGIVTLIGAAIGLMNIMLVQVNERTREIGINMAIGAKQQTIRRQFLTESIIICLVGGILGIILGIIVGNIVAGIFNVTFFIPWGWVLGGIILCFVTGIAAGYYPAVKASKLDPIEALRYE
ncbi:MAG: ABC transporter permease [Fimbriimonadaceae bacterium]|nr:ABC transporter permease [Chitinophagales bacterium]